MNFLYKATLNFKGFEENGFLGKVDMVDMVLLEYYRFWEMRREPKRLNNHIWIDRKGCLKSLPFLGIKSVDVLSRRNKKLKELGLITTQIGLRSGNKRVYILLTETALNCLDCDYIKSTFQVDKKKIERVNHPNFTPHYVELGSNVAVPDFKDGCDVIPTDYEICDHQTLKSHNYINEDKDYINNKKTYKKANQDIRRKFQKLCKLYGSKADVIIASDLFYKIDPDDVQFEQMLACVKAYNKNPIEHRFKKRLSRWLIQEVYKDYDNHLKTESGNKTKCQVCIYRKNDNCNDAKKDKLEHGTACTSFIKGQAQD